MKQPGGVPHRHSLARRNIERQQDLARRGWALQQRNERGAARSPGASVTPGWVEPGPGIGVLGWIGVVLVLALAVVLVVFAVTTVTDDDGPTKTGAPGDAPATDAGHGALAAVGDSGDFVIEIQALLRDGWGYEIVVDGSYGTQTAAAVAAFQSTEGLPTTGVVDQATYEALRAAPETTLAPVSTTSGPIDGTPMTGPPPTEVVDP